jgi:Ca2+-transporting ATPase
MGKIQAGVTEAAKEKEQTPLQNKLEEFGDQLSKMIGLVCIAVWAINYKHFNDPMHGSFYKGAIYYFKIAVALAVAAIPEGLPTVITMCLAIGTKTMAQRNAIVRKLPSVETLGCTTVICSDKTGTLTTNQMCVVRAAFPQVDGGMKDMHISGTSYDPFDGVIQNFDASMWSDQLVNIARVGTLCNMSRLTVGEGKVLRDGEPTEAALRVFVEKLGCPDAGLQAEYWRKERKSTESAMAFSNHWKKGMEEIKVLEFDRDRKSMSVLYKDQSSGKNVLYVKGASEMVFGRCTKIMLSDGSIVDIDAKWKQRVSERIEGMATDALRTIGLAIRTDLETVTWGSGKTVNLESIGKDQDDEFFEKTENFIAAEQDMIFCGMVGILDPPRKECQEAVETCKRAGISVIMITGDNKTTAQAIAEKLGILKPGANHSKNSYTGKQFEDLSEEKKFEVLKAIMAQRDKSADHDFEGAVFSRTEPTHKRQIVKILKNLQEVAAMTGDGVNDAPALKEAAIGIAMGIAGTEVAKNAADMILQDDNFQSIVAAVAEGRSIYSNMKARFR